MTVSTRSTQPCLSYILIQLAFIACLTRAPGQRRFPVVQDLAGELPVELAPQESEDVLGAQAERGAAPGAAGSRRRVAGRRPSNATCTATAIPRHTPTTA